MLEDILHVESDNLVIKLDIDNNILLAYDCIDINELSNEGILNEVGLELSSSISTYFKINIEDYGVSIVHDEIELIDAKNHKI